MAKSFRVLYVASEIKPFLNETYVSEIVRKLPQEMQEKGVEIRILVPRFGLINERKNRLHEVVRLSGLNISIGDDDKPLIIKVASIPAAKLQVYFIDNEDYFKRKTVFKNKSGKFHKDNDERCLFFCRGVLETVIKLGWSPDIIHCNDWMSSLIPLLIKTTFSESHLFENTKCIYSIYNNEFKEKLDKKFIDKMPIKFASDHPFNGLNSLKIYNAWLKILSIIKKENFYNKVNMKKNKIYIIAEIGSNHNGNIVLAKKMILAAKKAGADAVKFQIFKAEEFMSNKKIIYSIKSVDSFAKIITMGDFNDDPNDKSIKEELQTSWKKNKTAKNQIFNPMESLFKKGYGTSKYRGNWNMLDQLLITETLLNNESFKFIKAGIFNKKFLINPEGNYKGYPYRSFYNGWLGGYSDHFPVFLMLGKKIN